MTHLIVSLLFFIFCTNPIYGEEISLHEERTKMGLNAMYELDYAKAWEIFEQLKTDFPESPVGYGMIAITAWNELLFKSRNLAVFQYGMPTPFDSTQLPPELIPPEQQHFLLANKTLQDVCEKLIEKNPRDALALYFKGMSYMNLAGQDMTIYRRRSQATNLAKTAGKIHKETLKLMPSLVDAKFSTAIPEYVVGTLPLGIRWLALLIGIKGNKTGAIEKLQEVADKGLYRALDAQVMLAILEAWKGDPQHAISVYSHLRKIYPRNFLLDVSLAVAYEEAAKDSKSSIQVYQELLRDLPSKAPGIHPGEIHFRIGKNYVKLRDYSLALEQFQKALDSSQGDIETKPLIYYNMALIYEERGEKSQARDCYERVLEFSEPNKLIEKEIESARKKLN